jgi:hypothetical protein
MRSGINTQKKLLRFFGVFVPVPKGEKVVLFGFISGTKSEFRIFNTIHLLVTFFRPFFRIFNQKRVGIKATRK